MIPPDRIKCDDLKTVHVKSQGSFLQWAG